MKTLRLSQSLRARSGARRQRGFTLVEIIIAMALAGVVIAGVMFYQSRAENTQRVNDAVQAMVTMAGSIKRVYAPANSYAAVAEAGLVNGGLVIKPFTASGTNILDPWGGDVTVGGSGPFFGLSFNAPSAEACQQLVSSMADNAVRITVHTAAPSFVGTATTAAAFLATGVVVKADAAATFDAANMASGCNGTARHVAFVFR